jgi:leucyl aminopeptidase
MTAFIARDATETISFVSTQADAALTNWTLELSKEYIPLPAKIYELSP